jgi:aldose 1-epimerase
MRCFLLGGDRRERDILWGYSDRAKKKGGQGDVLIPFPGRIRGGEYTFDGRPYQLDMNDKDGPNAIHGFLRSLLWEIESGTESSIEFRVLLGEKEFPGYPFRLEARVAYGLTEAGLECRFSVRNVGETPAPVGAGFHPYFTVGTETVDQAELLLPAAEFLERGEGVLPSGKVLPVAGTELDFKTFRTIGPLKIDHCFTGLVRDSDGLARARLRNPASGKEIVVWMDERCSYIVAFTGDTISPPDARRAVAIEPMTCAPDAFNHAGWGAAALEPDQTLEGRFGVSIG